MKGKYVYKYIADLLKNYVISGSYCVKQGT